MKPVAVVKISVQLSITPCIGRLKKSRQSHQRVYDVCHSHFYCQNFDI
jgi:hypothetical protein